MAIDHVDVLIIGAGVSGVGAAAQLRKALPGRTVAVLEARDRVGGTWDLFRYPGIRSDSDMFTFAYKWKPWESDATLADGAHIRAYVEEAARETGVADLIRFGHKVTAAAWDGAAATWTVTVKVGRTTRRITAGFLWNCTGYYDYDGGYQPDFPGLADYEGTFVHPQHWPEQLDYRGKKVVVIGSGATAVTLVPAMSGSGAEHVTMLQRTPTYILSRPGKDVLSVGLRKLPLTGLLPFKRLRGKTRYDSIRWENIALTVGSYQLARRAPGVMKRIIREAQLKQLTARPGQPGFTRQEAEEIVAKHLTPPYAPWDQRLCFVPDGDLWRAMREGRADIVTDRIATFTAKGIELESGETLEADIVVSATGLNVKLFAGIEFSVDGQPVALPETMTYKGVMLAGLPNFGYTIGYTNASWTLKVDLVDDWVVGLLEEMAEHGHRAVVVERPTGMAERPLLDLASGYVQRALDQMPRQGDRYPWQVKQNYFTDLRLLAESDYHADGHLVFS